MKSSRSPALRSPISSSRLSRKYSCSAAMACFRAFSASAICFLARIVCFLQKKKRKEAFFSFLLLLNIFNVQLAQLARIHRRRRVAHQVDRLRRLRERNDFSNRGFTCQQRADAIEAERQAAVRRRAVLERFEEEAEAILRVLVRHAQQPEHLGLRVAVVDTDAAAAQLPAV